MTLAFHQRLFRRGLLAGLAAVALFNAPLVSAQDRSWGPKSVQITVGFAPGGGVDMLARIIATELQKRGITAVVENRPGAGSTLAAAYVVGRPNDGSALMMVNDSYALAPAVYPKLSYDPRKDLAPVIGVAYAPMVVLVPAQSPYKTLAELMAASKTSLNWGSCGSGTAPHLAGELLNIAFKVKNTHVPYKGCGPALVDLLGGQVDFGVVTVSGALGHLKTGKLRALAITSAQRAPFLPDLPTVAEGGAADFQMSQWQGLAVPGTTPEPLKQRIYEVVAEIIQNPEMQKRLLDLGYTPATENPAQFQRVVHADIERMSVIAKRLNLKAD
jgi:tripartite-type tricarboxylate transporter receptor subunit TctC